MTPEQADEFVQQARAETQERISAATRRFDLGKWKRYTVDLPTALIQFHDAQDVLRVQARIEVAGTWSGKSESWLWPWHNDSLPLAAYPHMARVRQFGVDNALPHLIDPVKPCDEGLAWTFTSVASRLLDAQCVYRVPGEHSHMFLLLFDISRLS